MDIWIVGRAAMKMVVPVQSVGWINSVVPTDKNVLKCRANAIIKPIVPMDPMNRVAVSVCLREFALSILHKKI